MVWQDECSCWGIVLAHFSRGFSSICLCLLGSFDFQNCSYSYFGDTRFRLHVASVWREHNSWERYNILTHRMFFLRIPKQFQGFSKMTVLTSCLLRRVLRCRTMPDAQEASVRRWWCYENVMSHSSQASRSVTSMNLAIICGEMAVIKLRSVDFNGCWHVTVNFVFVMRTRILVERSPRLFRWAWRARKRFVEVTLVLNLNKSVSEGS